MSMQDVFDITDDIGMQEACRIHVDYVQLTYMYKCTRYKFVIYLELCRMLVRMAGM